MRKAHVFVFIIFVLLSGTVYANNALDFDGVDDFAYIPDSDLFDVAAVTMELWFYWDGSGTNVGFLTAKSYEELEIHTGGSYANGIRFIPTTNVYLDTPANAFTPGTWVHLACVYDPSQSLGKIYINGQDTHAVNHGSNPLTTAIVHSANDFRMGKRGDAFYPYDGKIDELRIWNCARSQIDIKNNMYYSLTGTETGLTAYWPFETLEDLGVNSDSDDDVRDYTGHSLNGDTFGSTLTQGAPLCTFTDMGAGLPGVYQSSVAWGDYDDDSDLDILLSGNLLFYDICHIYRNDPAAGSGQTFANINAGLTGYRDSEVAWGDYDNDGDLDFVIIGYYPGIFRNDGGVFTDIQAVLPRFTIGSAAWGDYDNDGDLDLLIAGVVDGYFDGESILYRNNGGVFTNISAGLAGLYNGGVAWGDYDNDGDLDILMSGSGQPRPETIIYRNDAGVFTNINAGLVGLDFGDLAWGDYDNDGDLDILLSGVSMSGIPITKIYRNDAGLFTDINAGLIGVTDSSIAWGDCDNDGDLDLILCGLYAYNSKISAIYRNDASTGFERTFTYIDAGLVNVSNGSLAWGDYDNDGDLDIILTGNTNYGIRPTIIYCNDIAVANTPPSAPTNLRSTVSGSTITFSWNAAVDAQTHSAGLSYNLRVGTRPGAADVYSSMALANGKRTIAAPGYQKSNTQWSLTLPTGMYYWSVQAIDHSFAGSAFAAEQIVGNVAYEDINAGLLGVYDGSMAWGDYDNDGDLDILLSGSANGTLITRIYRNDASTGSGQTFTDINAGLPGVYNSSVDWCDYDNDGDLDIIITGFTSGDYISRIYRNDASTGSGRTFTDINAGLPGVAFSSVAWGDYDNDGDQDLLISGSELYSQMTRIYRNDSSVGSGRTFTDINAGLTAVTASSVAWGDYDNDGDLDALVSGEDINSISTTIIYRNDAGVFTDINAGLIGFTGSSVAWGDYDNDGDLDVLVSGLDINYIPTTKVYSNNHTVFEEINAGLPGVVVGKAKWGDCDNDGFLEVLITGIINTGSSITRLYHLNNGTYTETNINLPAVSCSNVALGDYDNDGDLDIVLIGIIGSSVVSKILCNTSAGTNTQPAAPTGLVAVCTDSTVTFSWNASSDSQTPTPALSYNLRVGTTPGGEDILSPMAQSNGWRKVAKVGNQNLVTGWTANLNMVQPTAFQVYPYYWSVQAIDNAFTGSAFATEQGFGPVRYPTLLNETELRPAGSLSWQTNSLGVISGYQIQCDNDPDFLSPEVDDTVPVSSAHIISSYAGILLNELPGYAGLVDDTTYYWRMRPVYNNGWSSAYTDGTAQFFFNKVNTIPAAPTDGFLPANDDAILLLTPIISWNSATDPDWSDDPDHLKYCLELDTTSAFDHPVCTLYTEFGHPSIQLQSNLLSGYRYYYRVKAIDDELAESGWSAIQQFVTVMPPQNITITRVANGVNISWDAVPVNTRGIVYTVYSSTDVNTVFPAEWTVEAANLSVTLWHDVNASIPQKFYRITAGDNPSAIRPADNEQSQE